MSEIVHDGEVIPTVERKDPDSTASYGFLWGSWLASGEKITQSVWILPAGLTEVSSSHTNDETAVVITGGTEYEIYTITNRVTTSNGLVEDRSMQFTCAHK